MYELYTYFHELASCKIWESIYVIIKRWGIGDLPVHVGLFKKIKLSL